MCAVSNVVGGWTMPSSPNYMPFTSTSPDPVLASQMLEVIRRLDAIDKALGALDCKLEKPEKARFVRKLKRRAQKGTSKPRTNT